MGTKARRAVPGRQVEAGFGIRRQAIEPSQIGRRRTDVQGRPAAGSPGTATRSAALALTLTLALTAGTE
ncbi:MAG: hypothetical protein H7841_16125, partial [Magnetospirillum sp. WYHS-4]